MAAEQHIDDGPPPSEEPRPHDSITRRLIYALALLPIVPSVSIMGVVWAESNTVTSLDEFRLFHLLFSVLFVAGTIAIWRSVVIWTLGRKWLTALVGLIPFAQVVYARPLWDAGCLVDILRVGQHEVGIGLWVWLSVWVWWGWEKLNMLSNDSTISVKSVRMTPTARRFALSIGSIPLILGVFMILEVALNDLFGLSGPGALFAASAGFAVLVWILIWRRAVLWCGSTIRRTVVVACLSLGLPVVVLNIFWELANGDPNESLGILLVCLPIIGWGAWMAITISIWPVALSGYSGQSVSPRCPSCGYLLIGLKATRSPECGTEPTLDELWEATAGVV